ncbi:nickel-type superoxide dismutase maturation protease [Rivularia sp. PCC 7116]|uniref:nickel-type superoxide dismutase maturation protease n=1 Tax=Rivularia sp. PCC 7116 TaxID=373994 RepID=UPI00029F0C6F|nr:nickel-type superoxide dismutase maturation protease [Rivularia sp. PCC 7116]AFY55214.1 nickel-type superoxide dismutase maturation protease [Rivularia sp. PCC 7116]
MNEELQTALKLLQLLVGMRKRLRVSGPSMLPELQPGDEILFDPKAYRQELPQVGDIVVALHPYESKQIIKRVAVVFADGSCFLIGDNTSLSTDSRSYGLIPFNKILGKVTSKFP